jgi:peroxiredoxin
MAETLARGSLLRDIPVRNSDGREVHVSDFRGRKNVVLIFPDPGDPPECSALLETRDTALADNEAVLLVAASDAARDLYDAPKSALFITDRYGEIFFSVRHPEPLPDVGEVLQWLEFINLQCPE